MIQKEIERAVSFGLSVRFEKQGNAIEVMVNHKRTNKMVTQLLPLDHCDERLTGCLKFCIDKHLAKK